MFENTTLLRHSTCKTSADHHQRQVFLSYVGRHSKQSVADREELRQDSTWCLKTEAVGDYTALMRPAVGKVGAPVCDGRPEDLPAGQSDQLNKQKTHR